MSSHSLNNSESLYALPPRLPPASVVTQNRPSDFAPPISLPTGNRDRVTSACEPYRELLEQGLSRGRNAMAIWQELVSDHGFPHGYQTVKRFVRKLRGSTQPQAVGIIHTAAGEEAQADYGSGPMVRDPQNGKYRRTRLFVLTLGYSRKSVRLLVWRSSSRVWAELHEKAFRRLGGCPRIVVLDNLREGVIVADIYDPTLNPLFRDVLAHYGVVAMPCRITDPDRKGKVEAGVGHAQKTLLKGLRFESIEEAQTYLDRWEERWADTRIHGTTKRQVAAISPKKNRHCLLCRWNPSATTSMRTRRASGRLRRSRSGLLRITTGVDRAKRESAMGCAARAHSASRHESTSARAPSSETRLASHQS
jgi:transposase